MTRHLRSLFLFTHALLVSSSKAIFVSNNIKLVKIYTLKFLFSATLSILVSLSVLSLPAHAQLSSTLLQNGIGGTNGEPSIPSIDTAPDIFALKAGWWHYFLDDETLVERADKFIAELELLSAAVESDEDKIALNQQLDLIKASLQGYVSSRDTELSTSPVDRPFRKLYNPDEYLEIVDEVREVERQLQQIETELSTANRSLSTVRTRLDNRFAAYLQSMNNGADRVLASFAVFADRFTLMLTEERIRHRTADKEIATKLLDRRNSELNFAKTALVSSSTALINATNQLTRIENQLLESAAEIVKARANATAITGTSPVEQSQSKLLDQLITNAELNQALLLSRQMLFQTEISLMQFLADNIGPEEARDLNEGVRLEQARLQSLVNDAKADTAAEESLIYQVRSVEFAYMADSMASEDVRKMEDLQQERVEATKVANLTIAGFETMDADLGELISLIQAQIYAVEGTFQNVGGKARVLAGQVWGVAKNSFNKSLFRIGETPVTPRGILIAIFIMIIGYFLSWLVRRFLQSLAKEEDQSHSVYYTIGRLSHYVLILLSFLLGLSILGISLTSFAVVAGALAIGIGFGLQAIVNNFISGLIILFERSLKVGDFIEFTNTGLRGEVKAINVRSTQIKTNDNIDIIVPNSEFMNTKVVNWTHQEPYRRAIYDFRISFDDDKYMIRELICKAASDMPYTLTGIPGKGPQVWLVGYGEYAYQMQLAVWLKPSAVKRPQVVNAAFYWVIDDALKEAKVKIPLPQQEIRLKKTEEGDSVLSMDRPKEIIDEDNE